MNEKIMVVCQSHYGATKQYAAWIAEALGADPYDRKDVKPEQLREYDCVIYGGGLYAGGILGSNLVAKNPCKNLVVFTVGLADPETTDYTAIINKNFPENSHKPLKLFHFRGFIDYKKLSIVHRGMMAMMKRMILGKKKEKLTEEDKLFVSTYGRPLDFTGRAAIAPLVEYVRELMKKI